MLTSRFQIAEIEKSREGTLMEYLLIGAAIFAVLMFVKKQGGANAEPEEQESAPPLDQLRNLVADFGDVLQRFSGYEVVDSSELPAAKRRDQACAKTPLLEC